MTFTPWRSLGSKTGFTERSLAETLDGGQSFRWNQTAAGTMRGVWAQNCVELRLHADRLEWRSPAQAPVSKDKLEHYLGLDGSYDEACDALPWRSDPVLAAAMQRFSGLRLLRQPLGETLFGFLLSAVKSIPQIKEGCERAADTFGEEIVPGVRAMPDWEGLVEVSEEELRACKFGYRAKYLCGTARFLSERPGYLAQAEKAPYEEARAMLMQLPGVGGKVADCSLLFGAGKWEAFPVDTWIAKVMTERYGLAGMSPEQVALFGRAHFGANAGLAQQFLFSLVRES